MPLTPAHHWILTEPSPVDHNEYETASGLHILTEHAAERKLWRGVVITVGERMDYPPPGEVVHYTDFIEIGELHLIPDNHIVAWGEG